MPIQDITIEEYKETFDGQQDFQLVDVREVEEFEDVRLPNTINIPLGEVQARLAEIATDKPVVLVCRSGGRSLMAGDILLANGYDNLYNLLEGTLGWVRRDLPTEQG
ncbi:MAG: rhodanese-like domain-containing protein [Phototrophicaceae bacterium]